MPDLAEVTAAAARDHLAVLGGLSPPGSDPTLPAETRTLLLIGPGGDGFWPHVTASAEFRDSRPDPLDRWSKRVLDTLASRFGGGAILPSDGPPWPPFVAWALASGRFFTSPVGMLVHPDQGLMVSLRGALALPVPLALPAAAAPPCTTCPDQPCRNACPAGAFGTSGYAATACHNHLDTPAGADCMERGCAARRACPASRGAQRRPEQSAFHMRAFHRDQ